jgi:enolase
VVNIHTIKARQVFDSRGYPTVECDIILDDGSLGRATVPSGASTGSSEALELRDGGKAYNGKGIMQALANIREVIAPALVGKPADSQQIIDTSLNSLDGTDNKGRLGANATLAVSLAIAKAIAVSRKQPLYAYIGSLVDNTTFTLPMPMLNILNGGKHAEGSTDIQEFMIIPIGAVDFPNAMQMASEIYHALGKLLAEKGYPTTVGDEGGYAPSVTGGTEEALQLIMEAIERADYHPGLDVALGLDVAASELVIQDGYDFAQESKVYSNTELINRYRALAEAYPLLSLEDGLGENDWEGWKLLVEQLGDNLQLVADDLLVTNAKLLRKGIEEKAANAILIKPNQIGTLSETIDAVLAAKQAGWNTVISHRSGETEDTTIAHLAVGLNAGQIKTGSFARTDRIAKYNELLRIAEQLEHPTLANPYE